MSTSKIKFLEQVQEYEEPIQDIVGSMLENGIHIGVGADYDDTTGIVNLTASTETIGATPQDGWLPVSDAWTYASADDPVYQIYVSGNVTAAVDYKLGNKIKCTNNSATVYGFIVKVGSFDSGNNRTPVDIYCGTDYDFANSAITAPHVSKIKSPDGFPLDPDKWTISFTDTSDRAGSTSTGVWANPPSSSLAIHIGCWRVFIECAVEIDVTLAAAGNRGFRVTLSNANNSESDSGFTGSYTFPFPIITNGKGRATVHREKIMALTTKTTHYINTFIGAAVNSITLVGSTLATTVKCVCAYL